MTTPAVNINAYKKHTGEYWIFRPWYPVWDLAYAGSVNVGQLWRSRGASVSSPMTLGHFRFPTYWVHEGGFAPVDFDADYDRIEWESAVHTDPHKYTFRCLYGVQTGHTGLLRIPTFPAFLEAKGINGLLLSIKDQRVNLAQAFAERQQTVDLVGSIVKTVYKKTLAFRAIVGKKAWKRLAKLGKNGFQPSPVTLAFYNARGRRRRARLPGPIQKGRKRLNDQQLTQSWLAFQYGLKPLLQDAYGAMDHLNQREMADAHLYRSYCKVKKGLMVNEERTDLYTYQIVHGIVNPMYRTSTFHGISAEVNMEIVNDLTATLSSLGITNPAELVWELLPFSFVADWFIPVGNFLSAMDATLGWRFLSGSVSKVQKLEGRFTGSKLVSTMPKNWAVHVHRLEKGQSRLFKFERQVMSNFPGPRMPEFKNPITLGHFANFSSLLVALFAGGNSRVVR